MQPQPVILCGLGRVGSRVLDFLRATALPIVVIDNSCAADDPRLENVRLIVVAGSRIIKPPVVARFPGRLVNFHSGLLPHYRGPYSEFWAMYQHRPDLIGCSVHLIDEGIDTGPLLATRVAQLPDDRLTPQQAHYLNVLQAVPTVAQTIAAYLRGELRPMPQPPGGQTYTHPSEDQIARMTQRIGRSFCVDFIE